MGMPRFVSYLAWCKGQRQAITGLVLRARRRRPAFKPIELRPSTTPAPWIPQLDSIVPSGNEAVVEVIRLSDIRRVDELPTTSESIEERLAYLKPNRPPGQRSQSLGDRVSPPEQEVLGHATTNL